MTSTYYQYSCFSPFPIDLNEDQYHLFSSKSSEDASSSSSSISYPIFINPPQQLSGYYHREFLPLQHQQEADIYASQGGSSWDQPILKNDENKLPAVCKKQDTINIGKDPAVCEKQDIINIEEDPAVCKKPDIINIEEDPAVCKKPDIIHIEEDHDHQRDNTNTSSVKWMSSKLRLIRKMMSSDQAVACAPETCMHKFEDDKNGSSPLLDDNSIKNFSNNTNNSIRVCANCNTTKTPLWRSGPRGPKSLCNACGIRQRKARRALAAAEASANGKIFAPETATTKNNKVQNKEKKTSNNNNCHLPFKKRCRLAAQGRGRKNKLCFEDYLSLVLSKNSAFHQQVSPKDEIKEAAILLMALSYGHVHG